MISQAPLPVELRELFVDGNAAGLSLSVPLPPGRTVLPEEGDGDRPALWLSDGPVQPGLWAQLHAEHPRSGLWPLLLCGLSEDEPSRPWADGELWPNGVTSPDEHDASSLLEAWWRSHTETGGSGDPLSSADRLAVTAPYGQQWPGPAPRLNPRTDPDRVADRVEAQLASDARWQLGLVAAARGSDSLAVSGWQGPLNYTSDTGEISAVLRDWEDRFGVRVVGVGFADLVLSVAAPPRTSDEALNVAAEHFAFCPDNVWQGIEPCTLGAYAERLIDADCWAFWWD